MNTFIEKEKNLVATVIGVFTLCTAVLYFANVHVHHDAVKHTASRLAVTR